MAISPSPFDLKNCVPPLKLVLDSLDRSEVVECWPIIIKYFKYILRQSVVTVDKFNNIVTINFKSNA